MDVEFHEEGARTYFVDQLGNKWKGVTVSDRPLVDSSVVLDGAEFSIFLLDEEERGGVGTFGGANVTFFHVFLHKLLQLLLFELGESVDFSRYGAWSVGFKFDGVVPDPRFGKVLGCLFTEDFMVALILGWYWILGGVLLRGSGPFDSCYENWVLFCSSWDSGPWEELGLSCIKTSYDNGELGVVKPSSKPVDFRLDGSEPRISQD
jgi:hypothetical protein